MSNVKSNLRYPDSDLSSTNYRIVALKENVIAGLGLDDFFDQTGNIEDESASKGVEALLDEFEIEKIVDFSKKVFR